MLCFSDNIAINYVSLLVPDRQKPVITEQWGFLVDGELKVFIIKLKRKPGAIRSWFLKVFILFQFHLDVRFNMELS